MLKKNLKIFIADNDSYRIFVYRQLMEEIGYKNIYTMSDADRCMNSLVLNPDIIFLNYSIDNYSGLTVLKKIKNINPDIHVILFSEIEEMNTSIAGLKLEANDFILNGGIEKESLKKVLENVSLLKAYKPLKGSGILKKVAHLFW